MSKIDQVVFVVTEAGTVLESAIRDLSGYIEETTTPKGVAPKLHVRGSELWTWGHQGSFPKMIEAFDTEAEAQEALEDSFAFDFWKSDAFNAFTTRADAEAFIAENGAE